MTIHRFYIPEIHDTEKLISFPPDTAQQIKKVLRLKEGEEVIVFDGTGKEWTVRIIYQGSIVIGEVLEERLNTNDPHICITLYQALIPRDKFEEVLQKGTEVGVSCFVPLQTERSIVHAKDVDEKKLSRWQKIVQEAAEQSERGKVPDVLQAMKFESAIEYALKQGKVLIAWEEEGLASKITSLPLGKEKNIAIFIGPEGGFTQEEIAFAKEKGATMLSLGPRILRSETAGPVTVFAVLSIFA